MNRKVLLLVSLFSLVVVSSGCLSPESSVNFNEIESKEEISDITSYDFSDSSKSIRKAVRGEYVTIPGSEIRENGLIVKRDNQFYKLSPERIDGQSRVNLINILISESEKEDNYIQYRNLSQKDKDIISSLTERIRQFPELTNSSRVFRYDNKEIENSTILDRRSFTFKHNSKTYKLNTTDYKSETVGNYEYNTSKIANNIDDYYDYIINQYAVKLQNITSETENVIKEAINGSYNGEINVGVEEIKDKLNESNAYFGENDRWIVRYDNRTFIVDKLI